MSKAEFWTLNLVGGLCALLIVAGLVLGQMNEQLNRSALAVQAEFNKAQQLQNTAQNLVVRVAQAGQKDTALAALLVRHDFNVNLSAPETPSR